MVIYEIRSGTKTSCPQIFVKINGKATHLPALWLRERAQSTDQVEKISQQRLFNSHKLPQDLKLTRAKWLGKDQKQMLLISFSDGYEGVYNTQILDDELVPQRLLPEKKIWGSDLADIPAYAWPDLKEASVTFAAVIDYLQYGFLILSNTPTEKNSIRLLAKEFGHIRTTNFGEIFDVFSRHGANDLAYSAVPLGPHTDNPYREPTPGVQLMHCLTNTTNGGLSTLVDSLACAEVLKQKDPNGYRMLSEIPVRFQFEDPETSHSVDRPIIALDTAGNMLGVHYSPRLDKLPLLDEQTLQDYHNVRREIAALFGDPAFEIKFRLESGQCMIFDNNRVLHGRTAYDPNEGIRHYQGCYIDRDGPESLYRKLWRKGITPRKPV